MLLQIATAMTLERMVGERDRSIRKAVSAPPPVRLALKAPTPTAPSRSPAYPKKQRKLRAKLGSMIIERHYCKPLLRPPLARARTWSENPNKD